MIKVILWDFDGVILNSMDVRDRGFLEVLNDFPEEEVNKLMSFHRENGGLSRYVKFRYFFEHIRGENITEDSITLWASKFSKIMLNRLKDKKLLIKDNITFIHQNHLKYQMHIVSGSDQNELRELCRSLEIEHYFKSIHGSPTPKNDLVKKIMEEHKYNPTNTILIGDSINDFEAATINGLNFQAYGNDKLDRLSTFNII